jgi:sugar-specific transcriptional regulator TrmB/DNA-binding CsgD family transcriptional regulator
MVLEPLGISDSEEQLYRLLLESPAATAAELSSTANIGVRKVRTALASLLAQGLISQTPGKPAGFVALPPSIAVEGLFSRRRDELDRARALSIELLGQIETRRGPTKGFMELVTIVEGKAVLSHQFNQIEASAQREVMVFDKPPYAGSPEFFDDNESELIARGVKYRTIYERNALEHEGRTEEISKYLDAGEQAKVVPQLPVKLFIVDRRIGLIPLDMSGQTHGAALIHTSLLLDALIALFESYWERGVPLRAMNEGGSSDREDAELSDTDRHILRLLAAGVKDDSIARQIGLTTVTVRRHVGMMTRALNVETRFQLALMAASRGWV